MVKSTINISRKKMQRKLLIKQRASELVKNTGKFKLPSKSTPARKGQKDYNRKLQGSNLAVAARQPTYQYNNNTGLDTKFWGHTKQVYKSNLIWTYVAHTYIGIRLI